MRIIDADALVEFIDLGHLRNPLESCYSERDVVDMLESRPTLDYKDLVPHGEWEEIDGDYRCTNCHHAPTVGIDNEFRLTNFCPNCGADMRGDKNA